MNLPASSAPLFRFTSASLVRSHKDSGLWVVVSVPAPKKGGMIEALSTRFVVAVPPKMADLVEGDVCQITGDGMNGDMTKVGSLSHEEATKVDASTSKIAKVAAAKLYEARLQAELKTGASLSDADGEAWEAVCGRFSGVDYSEVVAYARPFAAK